MIGAEVGAGFASTNQMQVYTWLWSFIFNSVLKNTPKKSKPIKRGTVFIVSFIARHYKIVHVKYDTG